MIMFFIFSIANAETKEEVIAKFLNKLKDGDVIEYKYNYTFTDDSKGTNSYSANFAEKLVKSDTIIGAYYYIKSVANNENKEVNIKIYNGTEHYSYYPEYLGIGNVMRVTQKDNPESFKEQRIDFDGEVGIIPSVVTSLGNSRSTIFYFRKYFKDTNNLKNITLKEDTIINNKNYYQFTISYFNLIIDKLTTLPFNYNYKNNMQSVEQYYSDYKINAKNSKKLFTKNIFPKNYVFKSNFPRTENYLKKGDNAPDFEGIAINGNKIISQEIKEKLRLLYITEIGCPGCILSQPEINELTKKYKELKVLGIFTIDSKDALIKLTKEKKLVFDIIAKSKDIGDKYGADSFPTFFLIDKNNKVIYSKVGYFKTLNDELTNEIEKYLNSDPK